MCLETCVLNPLGCELQYSQSLREVQNLWWIALIAIGVVRGSGACYAGEFVPTVMLFSSLPWFLPGHSA